MTIFQKYLEQHNYENFDIKAVLFDMDGVLYDSMKYHARSWHETMTEYGYESTPEEFYLHEGRTGGNTINILTERCFGRKATEEEIKEIYKRKTELFTKYNEGDTIPFAYDMLKAVQACGLKCVLVTGSGQASLLGKLEQNFPGVFTKDVMVTAFDVKKGKPDPEPYLMGLERAGGLKPNQAVVVENAPMGAQAANAAGIFTFAINTGPMDPKVLSDAGANIVLPSMEALYKNWGEYCKDLAIR
ncbi:HAD family phosphatase [Dysgonomonas sp. 520]|uniref:HAD family hydrolase n=1 Tax=Dysgonomonas sp. 520 TaxID=2302931 RepID=UPI0016257B09|nr:HAD hydrolase-like protein [Dysgonomonas sp. 520]